MSIYCCKICGITKDNYRKLSKHIRDSHTVSIKEYYDKFLKNENEGKCVVCGKDTLYQYISKGYNTYCSFKCSTTDHRKKLRNNKEKFGKFTKKVSENQYDIWSNRTENEKTQIKEKIALTVITNNALLSDEERQEKYSIYYRCDEITVERLNKLRREQCMKNDAGYHNCRKGKFIPKNPEKYMGDVNKIIYRSGLELEVFKFLDDNPNVINWASEEIIIPYISPLDNKLHRYYPDILLKSKQSDGSYSTRIIEIKPYIQIKVPQKNKRNSKKYFKEVMTYGVNQAKWKAATEYCDNNGWKFQLLTEKEILGKPSVHKKMDRKYTSADLQKWLIEKAIGSKDPRVSRKILLSTDQRARSTTMVGKLYFYKYDPLYGDRMTKYDKFPMCIPIKMYNNGFLGLNLHYLSIPSRKSFLDMLQIYMDEKSRKDYSHLDINYDLLISRSSTESLTIPCIHRYLWAQCRSRFIQIYPDEFDKAIELPVETWVFNTGKP